MQVGRWVSTLGDINGDGADDVILGAKLADSNGGTDLGSTYIILGGSGVSGTNSLSSAEVLLTVPVVVMRLYECVRYG